MMMKRLYDNHSWFSVNHQILSLWKEIIMSPIGIIHVEYDMDSGYVYARFITGDIILIDCDEIEKKHVNNLYERSELDYLI